MDISRITDHLYVGSKILPSDYKALRAMEFDLVISMIGGEFPTDDQHSLGTQFMWLKSYDSFLTPIRTYKLIAGVLAANEVIRRGGKVLVFCLQGKRRSVTMAAAILISQGISSEEAMRMIKDRRTISDPFRWYVRRRIQRFERQWLKYLQ